MENRHAIVIGAGAGGLAAAADLAVAGVNVTVLERASSAGGKMRNVNVDGHAIDAGPTVFTMRWVFESLFQDAGSTLESAVPLEQASILARHWWTSGGQLDLDVDVETSARLIQEFANDRDAEGYKKLCADAADIFDTLRDTFMAAPKPSPVSLAYRIGITRIGALLRLRSHQTLWNSLGNYFEDARLRQLFARYATYVGSSPLLTPATLMLITHAEQAGVWMLPSGMSSLAAAIQGLAEGHGASFHFNTDVARITTTRGRTSGVTLTTGEHLPADAVIFNGDHAALASGELGDDVARATTKSSAAKRGLSAITWCLMADVKNFPLSYHNVFFDQDYPEEFNAIFSRQRLPAHPTVYICAQDRLTGRPVAGPERLLVLINAPANGDSKAWSERDLRLAASNTEHVLGACGLSLDLSDRQASIGHPSEFHHLFPGSGGSLYGRASHGMMSSFTRPATRTRKPGLYLAGGSVHPGPGVPMATLSGRIAARAALEDLRVS